MKVKNLINLPIMPNKILNRSIVRPCDLLWNLRFKWTLLSVPYKRSRLLTTLCVCRSVWFKRFCSIIWDLHLQRRSFPVLTDQSPGLAATGNVLLEMFFWSRSVNFVFFVLHFLDLTDSKAGRCSIAKHFGRSILFLSFLKSQHRPKPHSRGPVICRL